MAHKLSLTGWGGSFERIDQKRTRQVQQGGDSKRESPGCRYRGLFWDGAEQGAELGGWDGVTND